MTPSVSPVSAPVLLPHHRDHLPPPPPFSSSFFFFYTPARNHPPSQSPQVRPSGWSRGKQTDPEHPERLSSIVFWAQVKETGVEEENGTPVPGSTLSPAGTPRAPLTFSFSFSPSQSHRVFTADTMGCCSGRCTLIFICTLQLVSCCTF